MDLIERADRVFDIGTRTNAKPSDGTEPIFAFLNRAEGPRFDDIRSAIDSWFLELPEHAWPDLRARLRSTEDSSLRSAMLELALHRLLTRQGFAVDVDPVLSSGLTPDLRVHTAGGSYLIEAKVLEEPAAYTLARKRIDFALRHIRQVESADWLVQVENVRMGDREPSSKRLAAQVSSWLATLDYDDARARAENRDQRNAFPRTTLTDRGTHVDAVAFPRARDRRQPRSIVAAGPGSGRNVSDHRNLATALKKKAARYRSSGEELVLAVSNDRWTADEHEVLLALYGVAWEHPDMLNAGQIDAAWSTAPEGLWISRRGPQYAEVSAVILIDSVAPWAIADSLVTVFHNPSRIGPARLLPFRHVLVDNASGTLKDEPEASQNMRALLGLSEMWGTAPPFP